MAERGPWRFPAAYAYPKLKRPCFTTKCCLLSRVLPRIRDQELVFLWPRLISSEPYCDSLAVLLWLASSESSERELDPSSIIHL